MTDTVTRLSRDQMGQQIIDICTGQKTEDAFFAQADALATAVGGVMHASGKSEADALEYLDALHQGMRRHISNNWGSLEGNSH